MKTKQMKITRITLFLFFALFIVACSSEKDGIIPDETPNEEEPNNNEEEIKAGLIKSDFMLESVIGEGLEKGVYNTRSDAIMKDQWNRGVRDQGGQTQ